MKLKLEFNITIMSNDKRQIDKYIFVHTCVILMIYGMMHLLEKFWRNILSVLITKIIGAPFM